MIFETADGIHLHADVLGPDDGWPVILAHGGGQTRHAWKDTAERLAGAGWRAVALDLRGHGDSDWSPGGDYRIERFIEDLLSVARDLKRPPTVVGASLGGITGLLAEGESPDGAFSAIVLVDIAPKIEMQGAEQIVAFMKSSLQNGFASLPEAAEAIAAYLPHRQPPRDLEGLKKNLPLRARYPITAPAAPRRHCASPPCWCGARTANWSATNRYAISWNLCRTPNSAMYPVPDTWWRGTATIFSVTPFWPFSKSFPRGKRL